MVIPKSSWAAGGRGLSIFVLGQEFVHAMDADEHSGGVHLKESAEGFLEALGLFDFLMV